MIANIVSGLGPWSWMALGLVLLLMEILAPGVFLLWIGIAALIVGLLSLVLWDVAAWSWQVQVLLFVALALVCTFVGKRLLTSPGDVSDQPLLNRRGDQLIGRTATLTEPIRDGRGRVQLGDTLWRISGPDLPAGTRVRVVKASDTDLELMVEAV